MKAVFVSNYINHHQIPFCDAMYRRLGEDFTFVQTEPMEEERVRMGWEADLKALPYVKLLYEEEALCRERINGCDLLLAGWMDRSALLTSALASQVISNVPAAVLLAGFTDDWRGLLLGVDLGGLGTPIASLASLIALKFYLRSRGARPGAFLLRFSLINFAGLAALLALSLLLF